LTYEIRILRGRKNMITINNKFEVGEKAFSVYRIPVQYKCPICEGDGKFEHNGYEVHCKNCNGTGKRKDEHNTLLASEEVEISSIKVLYNGTAVSITYRVNSQHIKSRSEKTVFKTLDEAENYCKAVNTKEVVSEF